MFIFYYNVVLLFWKGILDCFIGQFVFMCMDRLENRAGECAATSAGRNGSRIIAFVCTGRIRFLFNDGNVCWYRIITLQSGYT